MHLCTVSGMVSHLQGGGYVSVSVYVCVWSKACSQAGDENRLCAVTLAAAISLVSSSEFSIRVSLSLL